jgi:hypothetical protein
VHACVASGGPGASPTAGSGRLVPSLGGASVRAANAAGGGTEGEE